MGTSINKTSSLYLKNNSGQTVSKGDCVILDKTLASSFTLTGSSAYTLSQIGVILDQTNIANGQSCLVAIDGYVPVINLLSGAALGDTFYLSPTSKKAIPHSTILPGDFGQVLSAGTTPDAVLWGTVIPTFQGCRYYAVTGTVTNSADNFIGYYQVDYDTLGGVTTGSSTTVIANAWRFTAPSPGYYQFTVSLAFTSQAFTTAQFQNIYLYKNGITSPYYNLGYNYGNGAAITMLSNGNVTLFLNVGDYINIGCFQTSGGTRNLYTSVSNSNYVEIKKLK